MLKQIWRQFVSNSGTTAEWHIVKAHTVFLLYDAGKPKLLLFATSYHQRLDDDQVVIALVSYGAFTHGKGAGILRENCSELIEHHVKWNYRGRCGTCSHRPKII